MEIGKQLRAVRTAFGLSQRELAKRAGVTNGMISLIEQDRVSPSVGSLQKILSAFPMTMAEFFTFVASAPFATPADDQMVMHQHTER